MNTRNTFVRSVFPQLQCIQCRALLARGATSESLLKCAGIRIIKIIKIKKIIKIIRIIKTIKRCVD